jgi:hypothetical protein
MPFSRSQNIPLLYQNQTIEISHDLILIDKIEIFLGEGKRRYPPSSFVILMFG